MKILRLKLHNFGVYAGDNEFDFDGDRPIVLIGGMNGRGKTTFLEAVLLALYGSNSVAFSESRKRSYSQYLKSFVSKGAQDKQCYVNLEFEVNEGEKANYTISRSWDLIQKKTEESIYVEKDRIYNDFLTKNWAMFIENLLPSALSSFFFFDGEKIAEMAIDSTNAQLKNAIRSMLGIKVLDVLNSDISRNIKIVKKSDDNDDSSEDVFRLREIKDNAAEELEKIDKEIEERQKKIDEMAASIDSLYQMYNAKGGDALERRQEVVHEIESIKANLDVNSNALYDLSMKELPLALVEDLLEEVKLQATDEHVESVMLQSIPRIEELLHDYQKKNNREGSDSEDFVEYLKSKTEGNQEELVYSLSDQALFQVNSLVEGKLAETRKAAREAIAMEKSLNKQLEDRESYLLLDINDKELQKISKKINGMEKQLVEERVKLGNLQQERTLAHSKAISSAAEFNKHVEAYLATAELHDKADRVIKYSNMALKILDSYQVELQKHKVGTLSETITSCYKKLANKRNLIERVVMDPRTLDVQYFSADNSQVPKDSLSAGEQQLMVISILWALSLCSKKKLPVIIDTPLSRLDSFHRTTIIQKYFPNAGEQTIILSTDSEIDRSYYELMRDNIGDEFTLRYDETTKSTSIERGYLVGAVENVD